MMMISLFISFLVDGHCCCRAATALTPESILKSNKLNWKCIIEIPVLPMLFLSPWAQTNNSFIQVQRSICALRMNKSVNGFFFIVRTDLLPHAEYLRARISRCADWHIYLIFDSCWIILLSEMIYWLY